jgi:DNA polymerase-3 subunit beta
MNLTIPKTTLTVLLQSVIGVVERKQTLPILGNVLLRVEAGKMAATATDLEIELSATTDGIDASEDGAITVPARKLLDITKAAQSDDIKMRVDAGKLHINAGRSRCRLSTLPAEDFPETPEIGDQTAAVTVPQGVLLNMIERTQFAMAQQDVRYFLNGMMIEIAAEHIRAVATDGHRLAYCHQDAPGSSAETRQIIVPRKGVHALQKLLQDTEEPCTLQIGSNHVVIELGSIRFISKLIDGKFPDYNRAIPSGTANVVTANRADLRDALARTAILAGEKRGVRLILEPGVIRLQSHNPAQEQAEEDVSVDYSGAPAEIGFNVTYLMDALDAMTGEQVSLFFSDAGSSCLLRGSEDDSCKYVVSPMRL